MISNATRARLEALLRVVTNIFNRTLAEHSVLVRVGYELAHNAPTERLENVVRRRIAFYMASLASDMKMLLPIHANQASLYDHLLSRQLQDRPRLRPDSQPSLPIPIPQKPGSHHHGRRRSPSRGTTPPTTSASYAEEPPAESLMPSAQGSLLIGSGDTPRASSSSSSSDEDVPYARRNERSLIRDVIDHSATVNMMLNQDHARVCSFLGQLVMEVQRATAGDWRRGVGVVVQDLVTHLARAVSFLGTMQTGLKGLRTAHVSDYDSKSSSENSSPEHRPRARGFFALLFWLIAGWCSK